MSLLATVAPPQVLEAACKQVAAEVRMYRESIRSAEELHDTTGVELVQGRSSGTARPRVVIKQEKLDRAANYERVGMACAGRAGQSGRQLLAQFQAWQAAAAVSAVGGQQGG